MTAVTGFLAAHAYAALFVPIVLELLGIPFPAETALLTAAAAAAAGRLELRDVIAVAVAAATLGAAGGYAIGHRGGRRLLRRIDASRFGARAQVHRVEDFFAAHGGKALVGARFLPWVRILAPWLAGAARMPFGRFMVWNATGSLLWAVAVGLAGYAFGRSLVTLETTVGRDAVLLAVAGALAAALALHLRRESS